MTKTDITSLENVVLPLNSDQLGAPYSPDHSGPLAGQDGDAIEGDLVVFLSDGQVCWDTNDEREPYHNVKAGDCMWIYDFQAHDDGTYSHSFHYMSGRSTIATQCPMVLIYQSFDVGYDQPMYDRINTDIAPDYT